MLAANKESMIVDPIDWDSFRRRLSQCVVDGLTIPNNTDDLFRERVCPTHVPRKGINVQLSRLLHKPSLYSFFNAHALPDPMRARTISVISPDMAGLIDACNTHPHFLSVLGVLPNQLRKLIRVAGVDPEEATTDISRTLFFSGYRVWEARQQLNSYFWREIVPEKRLTLKKGKRKRKKDADMAIQTNCKNSFHFLIRHLMLSSARHTRCACSHVPTTPKPPHSRDIRDFLYKFPTLVQPRGQKYARPSLHLDQDDLVRMQHDRGKIYNE